MQYCRALLVGVLAVVFMTGPALALSEHDHYPTSPQQGGLQKPVRLAYLEGGHYHDYMPVLKSTVRHLSRLGWLETPECLDKVSTSREVWDCLGDAGSEHLTFVQDAFWSAQWKPDKREANKEAFLQRVNGKQDIDLVLAMGTWAGQDLATSEHNVPTVVMSTSNAVQAGIIKSAEDSGLYHVHARVDPYRYVRQVRLFHDIVGFEKLGIVYEDSVEGRSYAGVAAVEQAARERGFEVVPCYVLFKNEELEDIIADTIACHERLAREVDGLYITIHGGVSPKSLPGLLKPLFDHHVPNFAMGTLWEVRQGALMSMAQPDYEHLNRFWAQVIAKICNGAAPRLLTQVKEDPQKIAINLEAAERLGFDFPLDILGAAETIHERIEAAEQGQ